MAEKKSNVPVKKETKAKAVKVEKAVEQEPVNEVLEDSNAEEAVKKAEEAFEKMAEVVEEKKEAAGLSGEEQKLIEDTVALNAEVANLNEKAEVFSKAVEEEPEKAESLIKEEIKRVEELKHNADNLMKRLNNSEFTSVWNGQTYDF